MNIQKIEKEVKNLKKWEEAKTAEEIRNLLEEEADRDIETNKIACEIAYESYAEDHPNLDERY